MSKKSDWPRWFLASVLLLSMATLAAADDGCKAVYGKGPDRFTLATASPGELGLLERLSTAFNREHKVSICWKKAGSGKSLGLLQARQADIIMVHAPAAEQKAVAEGWATQRTLIGANEFYLVGPREDPARIAQAESAGDAYARIAKARAKFLSRGDDSGTHKRELALWKQAGLKPVGAWYITTRDFMLATLRRANEVGGYFMTDSSTWVAEKKELPNLEVLFRGDPLLINIYHALRRPGDMESEPELKYASRFIDFVGSGEGQEIIRTYGKRLYGEPMYQDAAYARQYE
ncbi:MAG: substrate-binding domain-containing protein [Candidatus Thiosymbion ectosymbiont of Robbea hypermnestra]|nr:substrate-binding domain-containing protein [Candidatus Thiosymbion ectosymbiont of Robbea hypermnestra]